MEEAKDRSKRQRVGMDLHSQAGKQGISGLSGSMRTHLYYGSTGKQSVFSEQTQFLLPLILSGKLEFPCSLLPSTFL